MSTDPEIVLEEGSRGVLPCRVDGLDAVRVTWSRGPVLQYAQVLIIHESYNDDWSTYGGGYQHGYDILANFSLIIDDVMVRDSGIFFCEIFDQTTSQNFNDFTDVKVYGK